ncbi:glycosyltransferase family 4 protein [Sedimentisphaera salicampi]|uniref:UDP-D-galactose:(Glucosyl)lipopolysaccharide-1, 6-D-galactosyltransferase n=1 Tax=Sedimentisphaera salicampi TaxID=1941349 RepID=A0A1W6LKJ1_9BACT|nr:glycosyltransferase [Sedimentisphaera salicampi]ARN56289.1 UDP-D-galactose:(glucosyl)lipopolysaccharide-1, 6-D-galactosyltransferase [Sedimentisphaera salicampi]
MSKKKVLIINQNIAEYRIPILNLLSEYYELTFLHTEPKKYGTKLKFKEKVVANINLPFFSFLKVNLHKYCNQFDVVISEANIRYLDRDMLIINPFRNYKWIGWGIGVSASYDKKFDQNNKFDCVRHFIFKKADANIFYSDYPVEKYISAGFSKESLFVANNTTEVFYDESVNYEKNSILFVGTLYKQKKIYELLKAYKEAAETVNDIMPLNIIGGGEEFENIKSWISQNKLEDKVSLLGPIFDQKLLAKYFRSAYACISPGQAGLSVLTSMGYGAPFVTVKDAITGGEIFNIKNGENGILYNNHSELPDIIKNIAERPDLYVEMGLKAREHYVKSRTPEQMAGAIRDAVDYVISK